MAGPVSSTSPPGGNQVDGLPPASSNTGAPLASWNPKNVDLYIILSVFFQSNEFVHYEGFHR